MKAGLEIHQQLDCGKLFSRKPSIIQEGVPNHHAYRKLHLASSELGERDAAALMQSRLDKTFTYQVFDDSCSLIELDEEPPSPINEEALRICAQFSQLIDARMMDHLVVMRKIVVDGSNTSGFQRTGLFAVGGSVDDAMIDTITLEEDSAKRVEGDTYNLSRLGIPLIEVATTPCFSSPEQLKRGALALGATLRLLSGVKRGLGSIRQDVNISIPEGARVEIKGAQDVRTLDVLASKEVERQERIVAFTKLGLTLPSGIVDVTRLFRQSGSSMIREGLDRGHKVLALKAPGWKGMFSYPLGEGMRIGSEIAGYVRANTILKGLFHSDELPAYGIDDAHTLAVHEVLGSDAFMLIVHEESVAREGVAHAITRMAALCAGVSSEVRRANPDNTTSYLRDMPGAARMYPETDLEPIALHHRVFPRALSYDERYALYRGAGLNEEFASQLMTSPVREGFDALLERYPKDAMRIAKGLLLAPKEAFSRHGVEQDEERIHALVRAMLEGRILDENVVDALAQQGSIDEVLARFAPVSVDDVREEIIAMIESLKAQNPSITQGALMGEVMKRFSGKVSGKQVAQILKDA